MTFGYGIDAIGLACKNQRCETICFSRQRAGRYNDDPSPSARKNLHRGRLLGRGDIRGIL